MIVTGVRGISCANLTTELQRGRLQQRRRSAKRALWCQERAHGHGCLPRSVRLWLRALGALERGARPVGRHAGVTELGQYIHHHLRRVSQLLPCHLRPCPGWLVVGWR
jgi:hypothetical protein